MKKKKNTIIALATASGRSGIGIIRISGSAVHVIIKKYLLGKVIERHVNYVSFLDISGKIIDKGIALLFLSPKSFTGEDVLEFHGHGNPILLNLLIKNILLVDNVRLANPGEFSERAFLNGKIDLIQAEAISDIICSQSEIAIQASLNSFRGAFSKKIHNITEKLTELYSSLETNIDFSEHIDENEILKNTYSGMLEIIKLIQQVKNKANHTIYLQDGINIVIAGPPNVGKSSLLNTLLKKNISIVTNFSGTTRNIISDHMYINGVCYTFFDTAGLCVSRNIVEKIGIKLAKKKINQANYIFLVLDVSKNIHSNEIIIENFIINLHKNQTLVIIFNKIDLINMMPKIEKYKNLYISIYISIKNKIGINLIRNFLKKITYKSNSSENIFLARTRHVVLLEKTLNILEKNKKEWHDLKSIDLLADRLRLAVQTICQITGKFTHDDLLKKIFSTFCIGK